MTRLDPALDAIVPRDAKIEKLAEGFLFTEGPVWVPDGYLLFSDPNSNTIYRWSDDDGLSVFRTKSGYTGVDIGEYGQPGSNGLTLDPEGRLTDRRARQPPCHSPREERLADGSGRPLRGQAAEQPERSRLQVGRIALLHRSAVRPAEVLRRSAQRDAVQRRLSLVGRPAQLLTTDVTGPNGLAFSPDEKYLYVGNWDEKRKIVMRYEVKPDGTLANGRVFFDMTSAPGEDAIDGMKVDQQGNVYVSGPGGLWILSPAGKHSARSSAPSTRTTLRGATPTARRCTSRRKQASIASGSNVPGTRAFAGRRTESLFPRRRRAAQAARRLSSSRTKDAVALAFPLRLQRSRLIELKPRHDGIQTASGTRHDRKQEPQSFRRTE